MRSSSAVVHTSKSRPHFRLEPNQDNESPPCEALPPDPNSTLIQTARVMMSRRFVRESVPSFPGDMHPGGISFPQPAPPASRSVSGSAPPPSLRNESAPSDLPKHPSPHPPPPHSAADRRWLRQLSPEDRRRVLAHRHQACWVSQCPSPPPSSHLWQVVPVMCDSSLFLPTLPLGLVVSTRVLQEEIERDRAEVRAMRASSLAAQRICDEEILAEAALSSPGLGLRLTPSPARVASPVAGARAKAHVPIASLEYNTHAGAGERRGRPHRRLVVRAPSEGARGTERAAAGDAGMAQGEGTQRDTNEDTSPDEAVANDYAEVCPS